MCWEADPQVVPDGLPLLLVERRTGRLVEVSPQVDVWVLDACVGMVWRAG